MSLELSDISVLAYANNFTFWHYKTNDNSIITANYFDAAADMLNENDIVIANVDLDGTPATQFYVVTDITAGAVTVTAYA